MREISHSWDIKKVLQIDGVTFVLQQKIVLGKDGDQYVTMPADESRLKPLTEVVNNDKELVERIGE